MPVGRSAGSSLKAVALVCFEVVRVPAELISRPSREKHVVDELRPDGQFGEAAGVV